jgi:hypothetical protein
VPVVTRSQPTPRRGSPANTGAVAATSMRSSPSSSAATDSPRAAAYSRKASLWGTPIR